MRRLLSAMAAAGFALVATPIIAHAQASANRPPRPPSPQPVAATQAAARPSDPNARIRLDVTGLTPRTVTAQTPGSVSVSGTVTNTGDRRIEQVQVRLQRGDALTGEDKLRSVLRDPPSAERASSRWATVVDSLGPGESHPFQVEAPLQGAASGSLQVGEPGIYPLMVNVNGQPDHGGQARLAALSTLLPVLSVPGGPPAPKPAGPAEISVLWPLADRPRLVETPPGDPALLTDDELAGSFAAGGRLSNLLQAAEQASGNAAMSSSLCLAVDPDLLVTAQAMSGGYRVRSGEDTVPGRGAENARQWLARLRAYAPTHCLITMPYADADLAALSRDGQDGLEQLALKGGTDVAQTLLKPAQPLDNVAWPGEGAVDDRTLGQLVRAGATSVLLSPDGLRPSGGSQPVSLAAGQARLRAIRVDPLLAAALGEGTGGPRPTGVTTAAEDPGLAVQSGLAALAYRTAFQGDPGRTVVIAPPRRWNASAGELNALLGTVQSLYTAHTAVPVPLAQLAGGPPAAQTVSLSPSRDAPPALPASVTDDVTAASNTLGDLTSAMQQDARSDVPPASLTAPFGRNLLRSESRAWQGNEAAARAALHDATDQLARLKAKVTVVPPTNPLSWASGDSLLPAVVTNQLPVHVVVRVVLGDTQGVRPQAYDSQLIPAMQRRTLYIPVQVLRSGRLSVDVRLTTPQGTPLGNAARFEATSTAYGTITIVITVTAAVALVLLVARRIYRRMRSSRRTIRTAPVASPARLSANGHAAEGSERDGRVKEKVRRGEPEPAPRSAAGISGEEGSSES